VWVWFLVGGRVVVLRLYRVPVVGGERVLVPFRAWVWGVETGVVRVTSRQSGV